MLSYAWFILCESAVYILFGFLIAGALKILISATRAVRWLSGKRKRSVLYATLVGLPLPLCSCSVLPTALTLRRQGAGKGATLSFLISTPETSVTSILLTYALLGPLMAVFRPLAACITALVAGLIENKVEDHFPSHVAATEAEAAPTDTCGCACQEPPPPDACEGTCQAPCSTNPPTNASLASRFRAALRYAFVDLFDDIFGWVLVGIVAAAVIHQWLAPEVLQDVLGGPIQSMLIMMLIGVPLYVCAESSTPVAAVLIAAGVNPGAALVLLLVGPATNIGSIGVLARELGRRTIVIYLATIAVVALLMGGLLDAMLAGVTVPLSQRVLEEPLLPAWMETVGAIVFLLIGLGTLQRKRYVPRLVNWFTRRTARQVTGAS